MVSDGLNVTNKLVFRSLKLVWRGVSVYQEDTSHFRSIFLENASVLHDLVKNISRALNLVSHVVDVLLFDLVYENIIKQKEDSAVSCFGQSYVFFQSFQRV